MNKFLFRVLTCLLCLSWILPAQAQTYVNEPASVIWPFNVQATYDTEVNTLPENAFSVAMFDQGVCQFKMMRNGTTELPDIVFVDLNSKNNGSDVVKWSVKPAMGLTFTPTSMSFYIARDGTDGAGSDVAVRCVTEEGADITIEKITPHRINKTKAEDKHGNRADYTQMYEHTFTAEEMAQLKSANGFTLVLNNGYDPNRGCCYSDVQIHGTLDGTVMAVNKYTVTAEVSPAGAGTANRAPMADTYEEGSTVKISTAKNFGYRFINWTNAAGNVVSTETEFSYTVAADEAFTANYEVIPTYELNVNVDGGGKPYMIQYNPAPTVIDGKNMYEDGVAVSLTAISNPVMKFTNWSDGQSSAEVSYVMNDNKAVTANYTAEEFVVGWDFWTPGSSGRPADFYAAENDAVTLVLRNADGETTSWLDKSQQGAGGYEGRPGAVNWKTEGKGKYYWQTMVNATMFTDMKLQTAMVYNFNAYTKYDVECSVNGTEWTKIGSVVLEGAKNWKDAEFNLPAAFNNQPALYIRWIADTTSSIEGTSSDNDGICLGASYLFGKEQPVDDGTAPVLTSFVPAEGSSNASINGRIVLNFDEKVKAAAGAMAILGTDTNGDGVINESDDIIKIAPEITGRVAMFPYKNLNYGTAYTFTLPAGSITDLTDNAMTEAVTITFNTKTRPAVTKAMYDFIIPDDGDVLEAIAAASARENTSARFRVFVRDGFYKVPASTEKTKNGSDGKTYPDPTIYVATPNISFIGESRDGVVITNTLPATGSVLEGIGNGDVMRLEKSATGTYFQDLTMKSSMGDKQGRDIVLNDNSDKTIQKNIYLHGYQDTYVSNNDKGRFYFEGGLLRGRTDFLCGKGDVYYNAVTLKMVGAGYLAVPSNPKEFGYVFKDCEIVGEKDAADGGTDPNGKYTLGRPWGEGTPIALFIDTKMTVQPSAIGWSDMGSNGHPKRFAEYNSFTASGTAIDLSGRKTDFKGHANNPVLTKAEADAANYTAVMGSTDDWDPASLAEQAPAPANVKLSGNDLTWDDNDYAMLWAVVKNGKVVDFTTEPSYTVDDSSATWAVRAANEMGGLSEAVKATVSGICSVNADSAEIVNTVYYNAEGIRVDASYTGFVIKVDTRADGTTSVSKIIR